MKDWLLNEWPGWGWGPIPKRTLYDARWQTTTYTVFAMLEVCHGWHHPGKRMLHAGEYLKSAGRERRAKPWHPLRASQSRLPIRHVGRGMETKKLSRGPKGVSLGLGPSHDSEATDPSPMICGKAEGVCAWAANADNVRKAAGSWIQS